MPKKKAPEDGYSSGAQNKSGTQTRIIEVLLPAGRDLQAIRRIAELSAAPGTRLLGYGRDQKKQGFWDLSGFEQALEKSAAVAVVPAPWLDAIDADNPVSSESARRWAAYVEALPGAWAIEVASGGAGRRHVWAFVPNKSDRAQAWGFAESLGLTFRRGEGGRMRPIGSPHRGGNAVAEPIGRTFQAVEQLLVEARLQNPGISRNRDFEPKTSSTNFVGCPRRADRPSVDTLASPVSSVSEVGDAERPDGSNDVWRLCLGAIEEGRAGAALFDELMATDSPARRWLTKKKGEQPRSRFMRQWRRAGRSADCPLIGTKQEARLLIRAQAGAMEQTLDRWRGVAGGTDRVVLLSLYALADRLGSIGFDRSVRQVAEDVGVGAATAARSLRRLCGEGGRTPYLTRIASKRGRVEGGESPSRYRINRVVRTMAQSETAGRPPLDAVSVCAHDAFRYRALGKNALPILWFLETRPSAPVSEIARATHLHRSTVRRILGRLSGFGADPKLKAVIRSFAAVAVEVRGRWVVLREWKLRLDRLAVALGSDGRGDRQRERHRLERARYRATCCSGGRHYPERVALVAA